MRSLSMPSATAGGRNNKQELHGWFNLDIQVQLQLTRATSPAWVLLSSMRHPNLACVELRLQQRKS